MSQPDWKPGEAVQHPSLTLSLLIASVLSGGIVAILSESPWARVAAVVATALTVWFAVGNLRGRRPFLEALVPGLVVLLLFAARIFSLDPPFILPRLHVAGALAWMVVGLVGLVVLTRLLDEDRAFIGAFALAGLFFLGELALPATGTEEQSRWEASYLEDPNVGTRFHPGSTARNFYPDNPRGYFERADGWTLESHQGSEGKLERVTPDGSQLRITFPRLVGTESWQVKLVRGPFPVYIGRSYLVSFRARSDSIREISCAVGQNHEPWELLSPYREVQLRRDWQDLSCAFIATDTEADARLFFDLGHSHAPIEMTDLSMQDLSRGEPVGQANEYFTTYRFDSRGSRGLDRESPAPPGAFRIVLLGDSYTLGVGVREEDTFASQLERRLNVGRSGTDSTYFEVINSGVTGFDTKQERALYETVSHLYEPDMVLVVMNYDDDMSAAEAVEAGHVPPKPRLSRLVGLLASVTRPKRTWDYSRSIEDIKALAKLCGERGQRVGVVFFRGDSAEPWDKLVADVTAGLQGTGIPILDLGNALLGSGKNEAELQVHPSDHNYNEIAHGIAAEELEKFVRSQQLLTAPMPLAAGGL